MSNAVKKYQLFRQKGHPGKAIQHTGRNEEEDLNLKFQDQQQADEDPNHRINVGMPIEDTRRKDDILAEVNGQIDDHPDDRGGDKVEDVLKDCIAMRLFD